MTPRPLRWTLALPILAGMGAWALARGAWRVGAILAALVLEARRKERG